MNKHDDYIYKPITLEELLDLADLPKSPEEEMIELRAENEILINTVRYLCDKIISAKSEAEKQLENLSSSGNCDSE